MIEGQPIPQKELVVSTHVAEVKREKSKRKIHLPRLVRLKRQSKSAEVPAAQPEQKIAFISPRQLHHERHGYDMKDFMKRDKPAKVEHVALEVPTQENGSGFKERHPILYFLDKKSVQFFEKVKPALRATKEGLIDAVDAVKWGLGTLSRGNITKRLRKIERNPFAYEEELQAELTRSLISSAKPEDPNLLGRNKKDLVQGGITLSTLLPLWVPTGLPIPFVIYTGGSLAVTGINFYNTVKAFREKRFRKGFTYSLMTGIGLMTGFFPGAHNLTNTWYTELAQPSFDYAESDGMLKIVSSLFSNPKDSARVALGQRLMQNALVANYQASGKLLMNQEQFTEIEGDRSKEKGQLLKTRDAMHAQRNELPRFFRSLAHPSKLWEDTKTLFTLLKDSVDVNQQLVNTEHKLQSAKQLREVFAAFSAVQASAAT